MTTTEYILEAGSTAEILLDVETDTRFGVIITTTVKMYVADSVKSKQKIDGSTDILCKYKLGKSSECENALVVINTLLDLKNIDSSLWPKVFADAEVTYKLRGGKSNNTYKHLDTDIKVKAQGGKKIQMEKRFFLTT